MINLISEARKRGYKGGTPIRYVPHAVDYVEGDYFEEHDGEVRAYRKPKSERKTYNDERYDVLFDGNKWVEIVDLNSRSEEQKRIDDMNHVNYFKR